MARPKKKNLEHLENEPLTVIESGLGNMSEEDLKAIAGTLPEGFTAATLTSGAPHSEVVPFGPVEPATPKVTAEEVDMGARMATLEQDMRDLKSAMELWASQMNNRLQSAPRHLVDAPQAIRKASLAEQDAYCKANYERSTRGETPFNGIQDWRDQGSPGMGG